MKRNTSQNIDDYLHLFEVNGVEPLHHEGALHFGDQVVPIVNEIPKFVDDDNYADGNFGRLRQHHAALQLDSKNGTTDRLDTLIKRTNWSADSFSGKLVLECGCGAGPDTEILRELGADVVSVDLTATEVCLENTATGSGRGLVVQASIADLPFKKQSFDIVFCHRVIMHTPTPLNTLEHILSFVKPGGRFFVHSYARTPYQMYSWKYLLRPFTRRLKPEFLYGAIKFASPVLYEVSRLLNRSPRGRSLVYRFFPFRNYSGLPKFDGLTRAEMIEYCVHDTFDALSPRYDNPLTAAQMRETALKFSDGDSFEVIEFPTITLLRSK